MSVKLLVEIQPDGMRDSDKCRFCGAHYEKAEPWLCPDCKRKTDAYNAAQAAAESKPCVTMAEIDEIVDSIIGLYGDGAGRLLLSDWLRAHSVEVKP